MIKKTILPLILIAVACTTPQPGPQDAQSEPVTDNNYRDIYPDTWVATDDLGRTMPSSEEVGPVKEDKRRVTGIFYITWHSLQGYLKTVLWRQGECTLNHW